MNRTPLSPEGSTAMEEGPSVPIEQPWDSEGEAEICEVETDVLFQAENLAMEQDKETEDENKDSGEDSDTDADKDDDDGNEPDYIPNSIRGSRGHTGVSHKRAGVSNSSGTFTRKTKDSCERGKQKKRHLAYKFCPLPHRPSILHLLTKHFCQHPLLPERHGQPWTSEHIHRDSMYEMYLHCKNNHLREVWAYLWTSWYGPDKWKLWA